MTPLEADFHEAMLGLYRQALKACNYRATAFLVMVNELTGVRAAKRLLAGEHVQSGLYELYSCGRLDLTVEALVMRPEYQGLFEPEELAVARKRLDELGYKSG